MISIKRIGKLKNAKSIRNSNINLDVNKQLNNASSSLVACDQSNPEANKLNQHVKAKPSSTYPGWSV